MEKEIKFEELMEKLEKIVKELENGNIDLDDAINKYTEAMSIAKHCNERLNEATEKVNKILTNSGKLEDFEIKE
mgnify:CR=1 FL=1